MSGIFTNLEGTTPPIADFAPLTLIAGEDLTTVGLLVEITADGTVKRPTANTSKKIIGITLTKALNGAKIDVCTRGIVRVIPAATLAAGDLFCACGTPTASAGTALQDNSSLNTTTLGVVIVGGVSAGTAIVRLW